MLTFRTFSEIPLQDALAAWNAGFQDYYANLQMDCRTFLGRFHREDLLPEESVMLYADGQAVGFTLNGLRTVNGETMAWNGGTAVLPAYRGQGMGGRLLEENIPDTSSPERRQPGWKPLYRTSLQLPYMKSTATVGKELRCSTHWTESLHSRRRRNKPGGAGKKPVCRYVSVRLQKRRRCRSTTIPVPGRPTGPASRTDAV